MLSYGSDINTYKSVKRSLVSLESLTSHIMHNYMSSLNDNTNNAHFDAVTVIEQITVRQA